MAEYPVSVSLVNTQIYSALNHPRGEYCQLRTFKTQIQLNTITETPVSQKRFNSNLSKQAWTYQANIKGWCKFADKEVVDNPQRLIFSEARDEQEASSSPG